MAESAALLVDEVLPEQPLAQWVPSFLYPLRLLFARRPSVMGEVHCIVYRCIATDLVRKAGLTRKPARTGEGHDSVPPHGGLRVAVFIALNAPQSFRGAELLLCVAGY
jgi:hypothetical protein